MKTLPQNYQRNIEILSKNLDLGMSAKHALNIISQMEQQFESAGKLGQAEKEYIHAMRSLVVVKFTGIVTHYITS